MKRIISIVFTFVFVLTIASSASATDPGTVRLSDLTEEECIAFLKESGVEIPPVFEDDMMWGLFAHTIIEQVEENPNVLFAYGSTVLLDFATAIKTVVNQYYGSNAIAECDYISSIFNILEDNDVYGNWKPEYVEYNCYAYVIGETEGLDPGVSIWMSNGNDKDDYIFDCYTNMPTIANWIRLDLEYFGYTVNTVSTTMPDTEIDAHTHLICVRKNVDGVQMPPDEYGNQVFYQDYHMMRLGEEEKWYHKPGQTNPLKYKYTPSNNLNWVAVHLLINTMVLHIECVMSLLQMPI